MAATGLCRYDAYEILAAQLETSGAYAVQACDEQATHTAIVKRAGDGLTVSVDVEVCLTHDVVLSTAPGWQRSIRIRAVQPACPDEWQPYHEVGSHPECCATCGYLTAPRPPAT